ncbi:MAG: MutT/Nudix [uncultured bacterium]|nr:MAG: MutT/Nudix [uncultured bacterium]
MRIVVRAIIKNDDSLLVIKRIKNGETYFVFPGGGVDDGESHPIALERECKEELGLDVLVLEFMYDFDFIKKGNEPQKEYFYQCDISGGKLGSGDGEEYSPDNNNGLYEPMWIKLEKLSDLDLRPIEIKNKLIEL